MSYLSVLETLHRDRVQFINLKMKAVKSQSSILQHANISILIYHNSPNGTFVFMMMFSVQQFIFTAIGLGRKSIHDDYVKL